MARMALPLIFGKFSKEFLKVFVSEKVTKCRTEKRKEIETE